MGLLTHGLAAGLGYLLGRPEGRAQLARLGRQTAGLAQRQEVVEARERAQGQIKNQAYAVKQKITARSDAEAPGSDDAPSRVAPARRTPRTRTWRSRFTRSRNVHFPSSAEAREAGAEGTTTIDEAPAAPVQ